MVQCPKRLVLPLLLSLACLCGGPVGAAWGGSIPVLVKDANLMLKTDANIKNMYPVGNRLFFTAYDRAHGNELWITDGTAAGTRMVADLDPGPADSVWGQGNSIISWNGAVYFNAQDAAGWALWKTDGNGTTVTKVNTTKTVDPNFMVIFKGILYFSGWNDGLWKSDGTDSGTQRVADAPENWYERMVAGAWLFFTDGDDLYSTDGTTAGTSVIASGISPKQLTNVNGTLYFRAWDDVSGEDRLWTSDGTADGTQMVAYDATPDNLTEMNGILYFSANDPTAGPSFLKLQNGSPSVLKGDISPSEIVAANGILYFGASGDLWKTDGTPSGFATLATGVWPEELTMVGSTLFFRGTDGTTGTELWTSDGTSTHIVKDIFPGNAGNGEPNNSNPDLLTNVNGTLFFTATNLTTISTTQIPNTQIWKSDGTATGTSLVQNVSPGTQDGAPHNFANVSGSLYFAVDNYTDGVKLWQTNGTAAATGMVPGFTGSDPKELANAHGTLYFSGGPDLWKLAGTGNAIKVSVNRFPGNITYANGITFFTGWDATHGYELWKTDGTAAGTVMVKDINQQVESDNTPKSSNPDNLTVSGGVLYFTADNGLDGVQLWKSDGTSAGTVRVSTGITNVSWLTDVNGKLFFRGGEVTTHQNALYVVAGGGAQLLADDISPNNLVAIDNALYFQGYGDASGYELWKSDGTAGGTQVFKDIRPGTGNSSPDNLTNVNGTLFFTVWDGWDATTGMQVWKSDGTTNGTVLVKTLPTTDAGSISAVAAFHGVFAFVFDDGVHGDELWTSDGTAAGTAMVKDIYPGAYGSSPKNLTMANSTADVQKEALFFSAIDQLAGEELFILDLTPPTSTITAPATGAYLKGTAFTIAGTASDSMPGSGVNLVEVSTDGGTSWHAAASTATSGQVPWTTWSYTWSNPADGVYTIKSRATDLATNQQSPLAVITVTVDNTPPTSAITQPASGAYFHTTSTPITGTASDNLSGIRQVDVSVNNGPWQLAADTSGNGSWSSWQVTGTLPSAKGQYTITSRATDLAGNLQTGVGSVTINVDTTPYTMSLVFAGTGGGSLYFEQDNLHCGSNCSASSVYAGDQVTIDETPDQYSLFGGWSGSCGGNGTCSFTLTGNSTVTATFNLDSAHSVFIDPASYFSSIAAAYGKVTSPWTVIKLWGVGFTETLTFNQNKQVVLKGGYNVGYTASNGMTSVPGPVTLATGGLCIENVTIR